MAFQFQSSNPVLNNTDAFDAVHRTPTADHAPATMTLSGVVNRTGLLVLITILAAGAGYWALANIGGPVLWISAIAGALVSIGFAFVLMGNPGLAKVLGPIYAVVEGAFLGAFTCLVDNILLSRGIEIPGGVGLPAMIITASCLMSMLLLYQAGIIRPTRRFKAVLFTLAGAVMLSYLAAFVLGFFGVQVPFVSIGAIAEEQGTMALIGIGINVVILIVASLFLVIDFGMIEEMVESGAPKTYEWFGAYALLVSLAWIYFEAVKLVMRLALLFSNRE